jgi:hypothetical protein
MKIFNHINNIENNKQKTIKTMKNSTLLNNNDYNLHKNYENTTTKILQIVTNNENN